MDEIMDQSHAPDECSPDDASLDHSPPTTVYLDDDPTSTPHSPDDFYQDQLGTNYVSHDDYINGEHGYVASEDSTTYTHDDSDCSHGYGDDGGSSVSYSSDSSSYDDSE